MFPTIDATSTSGTKLRACTSLEKHQKPVCQVTASSGNDVGEKSTAEATAKLPTSSKMGENNKHHEVYYLTNSDGHKLYCQRWTPEGHIKALVCVLHGFGEHLDNYIEIAELLNKEGCLVFGHDHVGHGRSEGIRVHVQSGDRYVIDVFQHTDEVKDKYPNLPLFLLAHSMGGAIAFSSVMKKQDYFKGVVFIGPLIEVDPRTAGPIKNLSTFQIKIFGFLGRLLPYFPVSKMDYQFVTRNTEEAAKIAKDPLMHHGYVKAGWGVAMLDLILEIEKNLADFGIPFFVMHGEDDKICDVRGSKNLYERSCSKDKQIKIYEKAYHSLHKDLEETAKESLQDIVTWFKSRI